MSKYEVIKSFADPYTGRVIRRKKEDNVISMNDTPVTAKYEKAGYIKKVADNQNGDTEFKQRRKRGPNKTKVEEGAGAGNGDGETDAGIGGGESPVILGNNSGKSE